ncbi:hypothetical protein D3C77_686080 [compost metagenome]
MKKTGVNSEYVELLEKIETLYKMGVIAGLISPYDLSKLKSQINGLRTAKDVEEFKNNGSLNELIELTRLCGRVCCERVVKPNSPLQHYACSNCPIFQREVSFVD